MHSRRVILLVLAALAVLLVPVHAAGAAPLPWFDVESAGLIWDGGDDGWIGQGVEDVFTLDQAGIEVTVHEAKSTHVELTFRSSDPARGFGWANMIFEPPAGGRLAPGTYENTRRGIHGETDKPVLDVSKDHNGCAYPTGRFVVHEVTYALGVDQIQSFAATFEQLCDVETIPTVGQVWFNTSRPERMHAGGQSTLGFMTTDLDETDVRTAHVLSVGTEALHVGAVNVGGPDAARFSVIEDTCSGATLAPGARCQVTLAFDPSTTNDAAAVLYVPDDTPRGHRRWTLLGGVATGPPLPNPPPEGEVPPDTALWLDATAGSAHGREHTFRPGDPGTDLGMVVLPDRVDVSFVSQDESVDFGRWHLILTPTYRDWLEVGEYPGATTSGLRTGARPGVYYAYDSTGCNYITGAFSIYELEYDENGDIAVFAAGFSVGCGGPMQHGEIRINSTLPVAFREPSPTWLSFGDHLEGTAVDRSFTLTSTGNAPITFGSATTAAPFSIVSDGCAGRTLAPTDTCRITARHLPTDLHASERTDSDWIVIPDTSTAGERQVWVHGKALYNVALHGGGSSTTTSTTTTSTTTTTTTTVQSGGGGASPPSTMPVPRASGYWMVSEAGRVYPFGDADWYGNAGAGTTDIEPTSDGRGYLTLDSTGRVTAFGYATHFGDAVGRLAPGERATSLSRTPTNRGYWIFTSLGRVLPFGAAPFLGDMSGRQLNGPVLDSVPTPSGRGYYMVASDGGVFTFGDAAFRGSMGSTRLNSPVQSLVPDPDGDGYWLVAGDGGIFAFNAGFYGSMGSARLNRPVTGMVGSSTGRGYLMVAEDGGIFTFGDVHFHGSLGAAPPPSPVVSVAAHP